MITEKIVAISTAIAANNKNKEIKAWSEFYLFIGIRGNEHHLGKRPINKEDASKIFTAIDEVLAVEKIDVVCNGLIDGIHNLFPFISYDFDTSYEFNKLCNKYYIHPIFEKKIISKVWVKKLYLEMMLLLK